MFAVIKTGGKQYTVAADKEITVMSLPGDAGARVVFDEVLALFDGETNRIGAPNVPGASVTGEIVEQTRGPKVYAFKKRRRKNSKRKRGHRQDLTIVKITGIEGGVREGAVVEAAPHEAGTQEAASREGGAAEAAPHQAAAHEAAPPEGGAAETDAAEAAARA